MKQEKILKGLKEISDDLIVSLYYDASVKLEKMIKKLEKDVI